MKPAATRQLAVSIQIFLIFHPSLGPCRGAGEFFAMWPVYRVATHYGKGAAPEFSPHWVVPCAMLSSTVLIFLGADSGEWLDFGTAGTTSGAYSQLEPWTKRLLIGRELIGSSNGSGGPKTAA
jgi:hypothetical protein